MTTSSAANDARVGSDIAVGNPTSYDNRVSYGCLVYSKPKLSLFYSVINAAEKHTKIGGDVGRPVKKFDDSIKMRCVCKKGDVIRLSVLSKSSLDSLHGLNVYYGYYKDKETPGVEVTIEFSS